MIAFVSAMALSPLKVTTGEVMTCLALKLRMHDGMRYATDDSVVLDALAPSEPLLADGPNDVNENSVVLRLTYRRADCARPFRMLFTGDPAPSPKRGCSPPGSI
jgi:hypothetical protein